MAVTHVLNSKEFPPLLSHSMAELYIPKVENVILIDMMFMEYVISI